jgi:hypothetical protein
MVANNTMVRLIVLLLRAALFYQSTYSARSAITVEVTYLWTVIRVVLYPGCRLPSVAAVTDV